MKTTPGTLFKRLDTPGSSRGRVARDVEGEKLGNLRMSHAPPDIDASVITVPLDQAMTALQNKIEREWPAKYTDTLGAREIVLLNVGTTDVTSRSIRYLCAEKPVDPSRAPEYCLSAPPLNRTILDNLFSMIFVLEDLPARSLWYHKAAWREQRLELDRYRAEYGTLPNWQEWLKNLTVLCEFGVRLFNLSPEEVANPKSIPSWPNAGAMATYQVSPSLPESPNRRFMRYLNDWFYADLSQQSHLGGQGIMKRSSPLLHDPRSPERAATLNKNRRTWIGQALTLTLALASEVESYFQFGMRAQFSYLWGVTAPVIVVAQEMYDKRYADLLRE